MPRVNPRGRAVRGRACDSGFDQSSGISPRSISSRSHGGSPSANAAARRLDEQLELEGAALRCAGTPPTARTSDSWNFGSTTRSCASRDRVGGHQRGQADDAGVLAARSRAAGAPSCSSASASAPACHRRRRGRDGTPSGRASGSPSTAERWPNRSRGCCGVPWRLQVVGRRAEHAPHRKQAARDQLFGRRRKDLQRDVEALLHRVDHRIADEQVEHDLGVALLEVAQQVRQVAEHEARSARARAAARPASRAPRASGRRSRWCATPARCSRGRTPGPSPTAARRAWCGGTAGRRAGLRAAGRAR